MQSKLVAYLAGIFLCISWASCANAVLISSSVGDYDVISQTDIDLAIAELQPWWGNQTLATEFAGLVEDLLGASVNPIIFPDLGPAFLFEEEMAVHWEAPLNSTAPVEGPYLDTSPIVYAVVAPASAPAPTTIALLLVGFVGLSLARRKKA